MLHCAAFQTRFKHYNESPQFSGRQSQLCSMDRMSTRSLLLLRTPLTSATAPLSSVDVAGCMFLLVDAVETM